MSSTEDRIEEVLSKSLNERDVPNCDEPPNGWIVATRPRPNYKNQFTHARRHTKKAPLLGSPTNDLLGCPLLFNICFEPNR